MWIREPRVYLAAADSLELPPGTRLTFSYRGKTLAEGSVTAVLDAELIAAELTSGSLKGAKKLERVAVAAAPPVIRPAPLLRVGYPARGRSNLLFACRGMTFHEPEPRGAYRTEAMTERTYRLVRDAAVAAPRPWPDTLLIRLYDEIADEEIALERGELDVAIFWPGEASPHIREFARWQGRPTAVRGRIVATATPLFGSELRSIASLNQDLFRGDLSACAVTPPVSDSADFSMPGLIRFEVDSAFPGRQALERFLNREGRLVTASIPPRSVRISYMGSTLRDVADERTMRCLFTVGCPVITTPGLRPYIEALGADALLNLFECEPAGRKP